MIGKSHGMLVFMWGKEQGVCVSANTTCYKTVK